MNNYFIDRIVSKVGVTEKNNSTLIKTRSGDVVLPFIYPDKEDNIRVRPFKLDRSLWVYEKRRFGTTDVFENTETWEYIRYSPFNENKLGRKSNVPKGQTPPPFLSPNILEAEEINTLNITEGYIKAIQLYTSGLYSIGFSGISIYRESDSKAMFSDVREIIKTRNVKVVNVIYDADCNDFSEKHYDRGEDLRNRMMQFYNSFDNISKLLSDLSCEVCFVALKDKKLKGIDDLIQEDKECIKEIESLDVMSGTYFFKTFKKKEVYSYLLLDNVDNFYNKHKNKLTSKFKYNRKEYDALDEKITLIEEPKIELPFFAVGNEYYVFGSNRKLLHRKKDMLKDMGFEKNDFLNCIKLEEFINEPATPDNYKQIVGNKYNLYKQHEAKELTTNCDTIHHLFKHIFKDQIEIAYDYAYQLYFKRKQKLPILCLVSKEQQTGKNTFGEILMRSLFGENFTMIGNEEINEKWNENYITKNVVALNEITIDRKQAYEKLKTLATEKILPLQRKGLATYDIACNIRMIIMSNYEKNFLRLTDNDNRFWIIKVDKPADKIQGYVEKVEEEAGYFVKWLKERGCNYDTDGDRLFFRFEDYKTDAFDKVVVESKSEIYKEICQDMEDFFNKRYDLQTSEFTAKDIKTMFYLTNNKYSKAYISKTLKEDFGMELSKNKKYDHHKIEGMAEVRTGTVFTFKRNDFIIDEVETNDDNLEQPF